MIILHDNNHLRYGFEPNSAYPQGRLRNFPKELHEPLEVLPHRTLLDWLNELFEGAQPHPQGEYTLYVDLTDSPIKLTLTLLPGFYAEPPGDAENRLLIRISQYVRMYPPTKKTQGQGRWKGKDYPKDLNLLSRKVLQEFLLDLEVRKLWSLSIAERQDKTLDLPERVSRPRTLPHTIARPKLRSLRGVRTTADLFWS